MKKQIIFSLMICILMISMVSALLETSKPMELTKGEPLTFDKKEIAYNPIWDKYVPIKIDTWLDIPMISKTLVEAYIDTHTDSCGIDCSSTMILKTYEKAPLIDDINFYTIMGEDKILQSIRSYQFYIKTSEKDIEVNDYEWTCTPTGKININGTEEQTCENKLIGTHIEKEPTWIPYNLGTEVDAGVYEIKLEGEKAPTRSVDWVIKTQGVYLNDWATWGGNMTYDEIEGTVINQTLWSNTTTNGGVTSASGGTYIASATGSSAQTRTATIKSINIPLLSSFQNISMRIVLSTPDGTGDGMSSEVSFTVFGTKIYQLTNAPYIGGYGRSDDSVWSFIRNYSVSNKFDVYKNGIWNQSIIASDTNISIYASAYTGVGSFTATSSIYYVYYFTPAYLTLNSPSNNYISTTNSVNFNCSANVVGGATLTNMSLWTNSTGTWALNQTLIKTGATNTSIFTNSYANADSILWTCQACDSDGDCGFASENRTVSIDTNAPNIVINSGSGSQDYGSLANNYTINYTISDSSLDSCYIQYPIPDICVWGGVGSCYTHYISCSDGVSYETNFTLIPYSGYAGRDSAKIFANDSVGNLDSVKFNWSFKVFENNVSYDSELPEGSLATFNSEVKMSDGFTLSQAIFNYNGTNYTTSLDYSGGIYNISASIFAPTVSLDTNFSFNFFLTLNDGTFISTRLNTQKVINTNFGICGGVSNDSLINISLKDEIYKTPLIGTIEFSGEIISKSSNNIVATIYQNFTNVANASICFSPSTDYNLYYLNSEIKYYSDGYAPELYIIQRADMGDYPINLSLFDLVSNQSTEFLLKYQNNNLVAVEGAVIQLLKKYISEGIYEVVEAPITSNIGTANVHIDLNTNLYRAIIVKNGVILDTFNNLVFHCESELSGICTQNLFGSIDPQNSINLENLEDFSYLITEINNTITTTFSIPSGTSSVVNILLTQENMFGNTYLCNQTITSSSGSIDCNYNKTIGDSMVYFTISKNGVIQSQSSYYIPESGVDWLGNNFFIVLFFLLSLVGMAMASPEWMVIIGVITFVLSGGLWLLNGLNFVVGLGGIIWLIIVAVIIILKLSKQEDR